MIRDERPLSEAEYLVLAGIIPNLFAVRHITREQWEVLDEAQKAGVYLTRLTTRSVPEPEMGEDPPHFNIRSDGGFDRFCNMIRYCTPFYATGFITGGPTGTAQRLSRWKGYLYPTLWESYNASKYALYLGRPEITIKPKVRESICRTPLLWCDENDHWWVPRVQYSRHGTHLLTNGIQALEYVGLPYTWLELPEGFTDWKRDVEYVDLI